MFYVRMWLKVTLKASVAFPLDDPHTLEQKTDETKKKDKTNKMTCAHIEDLDQPGRPLSLISLRCHLGP